MTGAFYSFTMESMLIMGVVIILKHFVPKIDMWGMVQGDFRVMKKRKRSRIIWTVLFWMIFLVSVATIVYLSFQNGTSSAELGSDVIEKLAAEYYEKDTVSTTELYKFTYYFRQMGRTIAFFIIGILGTATIHLSSERLPWIVKSILAAGILLVIAWVTEKCKIYLPTRHYSQDEMMISMAASMLGFSIVSLITLIYNLIQHMSHRDLSNKRIPSSQHG